MSEGDFPDVCVITHPLGAAGENATRSLLEIISAITNVSLITAALPPESSIRDRHEVVEISAKNTGSTVSIAAFRFILNQVRMCREITRRSERTVIFFGATSYLLPILIAKLAGKTVVLEPRGDVPLTLELAWRRRFPAPVARGLAVPVRLLEDLGFRVADAIVTYTPAMAEELGLERFAYKLYPSGARYVDTDRFDVHTPLEDRDRIVGFLGRLDEEKGIRQLADTARRLPSDITFRFVGDGDLREWLEAELSADRARGTVSTTGWIDHDDVPHELNEFRLLVMPSQPTEGLPTTILESLACGTPVYATPVSGVPDVVRPGETGFLMNETNPDTLSRDIQEILARDDLSAISRNGRSLIETNYSFAAAVDRYRSILHDIDRGRSSA